MAFILIMLMCFGIGMENEGERKEIYDKKRKLKAKAQNS